MTSTQKTAGKTRPAWATLFGLTCGLGGIGVLLVALYFFSGAPGSVMAAGGLLLVVAVILGFAAAVMFFMSRRV